jgi:hypothetical protein
MVKTRKEKGTRHHVIRLKLAQPPFHFGIWTSRFLVFARFLTAGLGFWKLLGIISPGSQL